jgi:predicted permease
VLSDLKYAIRQLGKAPGFTVLVMLILAIGIGINTAAFTFIEAILLRALPVRDPARLVFVAAERPTRSEGEAPETLSYPAYERLRDQSQTLDGVLIAGRAVRMLATGTASERTAVPVKAGQVSGNYFALLGVPAAVGRILSADDDRKGAPRSVAVLSHDFWQRQFAGDPGILGRSIRIDQIQFVVVGVAAAGFSGVEAGIPVDLWVPIQTLPLLDAAGARQLQEPEFDNFLVLGRRRPGVSEAAAAAELNTLFQAEGAELGSGPERSRNWGKIILFPGGSGRLDHRTDVQQSLLSSLAVTALVLVLACANVASMLLARTAARQREIAVRAALGASRRRLIRQLMSEGLLLAGAGGLLGLGFAVAGLSALSHLWQGPSAGIIDLAPDGRILAFTLVLSAGTGLLVGLVPALRGSRIDLVSDLKNQAQMTTGGSRQWLNRALVIGQIAISVCLLAGAGLFIHSLQSLQNVDLGFPRAGLRLVTVGLDNYDANRQVDLAKDLTLAFGALPGVQGAAVVAGGLWDGSHYISRVRMEGYEPAPDENMNVYFAQVGPAFFSKMGIPILRGRDLEFADVFPASGTTAAGPSVVINASVARRFFGAADPLGRHISLPNGRAVIVGVAGDVKYVNLRDDRSLQVFIPYWPGPKGNRLTVALRTTGEQRGLAAAILATTQRVDPSAHVREIASMDDLISQHYLLQERLIAQIAGYSGAFALGLACLGLYGLLAYNVAQRTREIGVRSALGARPRDIVALIVGQALGLALAGGVAGALGAAALVHLAASRLYGVTGKDPLTFLGTAGILTLVALLASWVPARRAAQIDPMLALRSD